jgi:hypothetical protein
MFMLPFHSFKSKADETDKADASKQNILSIFPVFLISAMSRELKQGRGNPSSL